MIKQAPVGAILADGDGDTWTKTADGAIAHVQPDVVWAAADLDEAVEHFGPFIIVATPPASQPAAAQS